MMLRRTAGICWAIVGLMVMHGCGGPSSPSVEPEKSDVALEAPVAQGKKMAEAPASAAPSPSETAPEAAFVIKPGPEANTEIQEALIEAEPGDTILLEAGAFKLSLGLSLDVDKVTLRGRGMDKTILDFKGQVAGSEGLHVTSDGVTLEDFAVLDTKGNAIKSHTANNIVYRHLRAEWTGGPKSENGAYGLYPVNSTNVLVEGCVAIGASDSGIYVGQSKNVIVRNCRVEYNVAGIEIENCHGADVINNVATNNTGGLLVFDLPDLPVQGGHDVRLLNNKVYNNNTKNFAPPGNIVGTVSTGTGVLVMANTNVEIFDNEIRDHATVNVLVISYLATGIQIKDPKYYPYAERISIHDNAFGKCGYAPGKESGGILEAIVGTPLPDILWDGVVNPEKVDAPDSIGIVIQNNSKTGGEVTFANMGGLASLRDPSNPKVDRNIAAYTGTLPAIAPITIEGAG